MLDSPHSIRDHDDFDSWYQEESKRRLAVYRVFRSSLPAQKNIIQRCSEDFFLWVDNFAWTYDPRPQKSPHSIPFVLWDFQRDFAKAWLGHHRDDSGQLWPIILDKSRDMGVTWTALACILWEWQFHGRSIGLISRVQNDVDENNQVPSTLMGRLRWMCKMQPKAMRPTGYREHKRHRFHDTFMSLVNPDNGAEIAGTSTVDDAFRSRRFWRVFVDEGNAIFHLKRLMESLGDVTTAPVIVSSARGRGTHFARIVHGEAGDVVEAGGRGLGWYHIRCHYSQHPDRDPSTSQGKAWVEREKARRTPEAWAQEQEIDYTASMPDRCIPEFNRQFHLYSPDSWDQYILPAIDRSAIWFEGWDFGSGPSLTAVVWAAYLEANDTLYIVDYRAWDDCSIDRVVADVAKAGWYTGMSTSGLMPDYRVGDIAGAAAGPRSIGGRRVTPATSWISNLSDYGVAIEGLQVIPFEAISALRMKVQSCNVVFGPETARRHHQRIPSLVECVEQYHWDTPAGSSPETWIGASPKPSKDVYSHTMDALHYIVKKCWSRYTVDILRQSNA